MTHSLREPAMHAATTADVTTLRTPHRAAPLAPRALSWRDARVVAEVPAMPARTVQLLLASHGHLGAEAVTGRFDRVTGAAVRAFQRATGLDVTGVASRATADALLHDPELR